MTSDTKMLLAAALRKDFCAFFAKCFHHLNPTEQYLHNWHVQAIAFDLAEALEGRNKRPVFTLPPRHLKSTIVSVAWPAFVLGHFPSMKFIGASYSQDLANKLSNETRSIMKSDWYKHLFSETVISPLKDTQEYFETTQHGGRFATSVGGPMTGFGADIIIVDDPQKPMDMQYEIARHKVRDWFFGTVTSRLNSLKDGIIILVMQRLNEDDLVGNIEGNPDFKILKVPVRAEEDLVYKLSATQELHFPAGSYLQETRFGSVEFDSQRKLMGSREFSAQYQQNPLPRDGGTFNIDRFKICDDVPLFSELVMSVDVASTEEVVTIRPSQCGVILSATGV